MLPIVFSHANSFPASTYRLLFKQLKARGFEVSAVERYGHDPEYPVTNNWPHLVQNLADFATRQVERLGQPVFLVGHSLGGFLSVMAAARHPELVRGVLLIDSPLIGGWKANAVGMAKSAQVIGSISPGKISRQLVQQRGGAGALSQEEDFCALAPRGAAGLHHARPQRPRRQARAEL
jgi:pimeloyl-ACP methyl ester carboxylesterase